MASSRKDGHVVSKEELDSFKRDYYSAPGGPYNLAVQIPHLSKLADGYIDEYERTGHWTDALKAHTLCTSVSARSIDKDHEVAWAKKAFTVQKTCIGTKKYTFDFQQNLQITKRIMLHLRETREYCSEELKKAATLSEDIALPVEFERFYNYVRQISLYCSKRMTDLAKIIFDFSIESISEELPCAFCVIALGSLAKGEATPYSDFEYMFLIEIKNDRTLAYFHKLALSSYFIIGSIKETKLECMAIKELEGWFHDRHTSGFKIDGLKEIAGNIPTGNGNCGDYQHIFLPSELKDQYLEILNNPPKTSKQKNGDFTTMLNQANIIYKKGVNSDRLVKAFNMLKSFPANANRKKANIEMFKADSEKFGFKPIEIFVNKGFSLHTKDELYRFPSILLEDISILLEVCEPNSWETLHSLMAKNMLSHSVNFSLSFMLACSCYFRLSTYLYYDSQDDRLSVLPISKFQITRPRRFPKIPEAAGSRWVLSQNLFNLYCKHSIALKNHLLKLMDIKDVFEILKLEFCSPSWLVKFQTYHYCNRWSECQDYFQEHVCETTFMQNPELTIRRFQQEFPNDLSKTWRCVKALTYSLAQRRHEKITLQYNESFLAKFENSNQSPSDETQQFLLADIYSEIGASHYGLSKYATAQEYFRRAIRIWKTLNLLGEDSIVMVAKMQLKLGECFLMMFKYEKSLKHLLKAMQICIDESLQQTAKPTPTVNIFLESPESRLVFITTPTVILAHVIWTIGIVYQYTKYYQRAALYFQKSLEMFLELYGEESCHRDIANTLYHLGVAIESVKRGIPFSDFYLESMIMTTQLYCNDHLHLTLVLEKADLSGTKEFYDICLNVFPQLSRFGVAHSQSATVVSRFGYHLTFAGLPGRASQAFDIALNMFENPCSEDEYSYVYKAQTIAGQAFNDWKNGDGLLAEQLFAEAFRIFESTNPTDSLLDQAEILVNKGDMYLAFAEKSDVRAKSSSFQQQALKCYQLALCKQKLGSCDFTHPQLTEINQKIEKLLSEVL